MKMEKREKSKMKEFSHVPRRDEHVLLATSHVISVGRKGILADSFSNLSRHCFRLCLDGAGGRCADQSLSNVHPDA